MKVQTCTSFSFSLHSLLKRRLGTLGVSHRLGCCALCLSGGSHAAAVTRQGGGGIGFELRKGVMCPFPLAFLDVTSGLNGDMLCLIESFGARLLCTRKGYNERRLLGKSRIEETVKGRCLKQKSCRMANKVLA